MYSRGCEVFMQTLYQQLKVNLGATRLQIGPALLEECTMCMDDVHLSWEVVNADPERVTVVVAISPAELDKRLKQGG